ncbi:MAG: HlyD family efflux transporter periplasmic adaptor subunit [Chitinophagia bacterium]|nr:HlyD family efflux transporter periplasmic adaptor subunit [Chitinophagia bacterium]
MKKSYLFVALLLGMASCKPKFETTQPKTGPVTEAVFASGTIEPKDAYNLNSLYDGYLLKSFVVENDLVKDGQLLFQLDNKQQNTQVERAKAAEQFAASNAADNSPQLGQLKAQAAATLAKRTTDSVTLGRMERLLRTQSVSRQEVDNARLVYQTSVANHLAALEALQAATNKARQDLIISRADLQNAAAGNNYYNLVAIGNSKVYQVFKKPGDLVRKGDQVAQLGNPDSIVINLDLDEGNIGKIALGQQVLVELNTQKNKQYKAVISKIYPHFNENAQSYKVEARFTEAVPVLISGTQLQANIITSRKEQALLVPHVFVMSNSKVLVKNGDKADTVLVQTGIVSDEWVEITQGLKGNETLLRQK